jgi:hypothetical protein
MVGYQTFIFLLIELTEIVRNNFETTRAGLPRVLIASNWNIPVNSIGRFRLTI